jgi:hypothetical protein
MSAVHSLVHMTGQPAHSYLSSRTRLVAIPGVGTRLGQASRQPDAADRFAYERRRQRLYASCCEHAIAVLFSDRSPNVGTEVIRSCDAAGAIHPRGAVQNLSPYL